MLQSLLDLSVGQISDLMHLRRLYLTKRGLLAAQRRQLVSSIAFSDDQLRHPSDNSVDAADVGQSLKDNAREDQRVLYRVARVVWSGVRFIYPCVGLSCTHCVIMSTSMC